MVCRILLFMWSVGPLNIFLWRTSHGNLVHPRHWTLYLYLASKNDKILSPLLWDNSPFSGCFKFGGPGSYYHAWLFREGPGAFTSPCSQARALSLRVRPSLRVQSTNTRGTSASVFGMAIMALGRYVIMFEKPDRYRANRRSGRLPPLCTQVISSQNKKLCTERTDDIILVRYTTLWLYSESGTI